MTFSVKRGVDPVNELLRTDIEEEEPLDIDTLVQRTSRIHAGFLFESCGQKALQELCHHLGASKRSAYYKGGMDFGHRLGLKAALVQCIHNQPSYEDPIYNTFLAYVQRPDSTIGKIISVLEVMERFDIIQIIEKYILKLADDLQETSLDEDEGYENSINSGPIDGDHNEESNGNILRPSFIPVAGFIYRIIPDNIQITEVRTDVSNSSHSVDQERYLQNANDTNPKKLQNQNFVKSSTQHEEQRKVDKTVMLTFASDGQDIAEKVAKIFRQEFDEKRIGVLILNDHAAKVNANAEKFIFSCFVQVDYVVPIITEGYLNSINSPNATFTSSLNCLDPKYVKYIFNLMNSNYSDNGCVNNKVRCLIPDKLLYLTQQSQTMKLPLFRAWAKQSETECLKKRMLMARI